ncbi:hypothetical protein KNE206_53240 [Kitasatospora sp. NE20-6]|uniref:hypothetical protein n=1 Tax=Kitasatospora sp. NE20-6 TaxID=2859066 RepID=UPI0034DB8105
MSPRPVAAAVDFGIDDLEPADSATEHNADYLSVIGPELTLLSQQTTTNPHTALLKDGYYVAFDTAHMWNDMSGRSSLIAVHTEQDFGAGTFRVEFMSHALIGLAEQWLVDRGADPDAFTRDSVITAADEETTRLEEMLRGSGGRFTAHDDYTHAAEPYDVWVIATDTLAQGSEMPVRVFHEQRQVDTDTYTLREGHFPSIEEALEWTKDPNAPLPSSGRRPNARAAAARTTTARTGTQPAAEVSRNTGPSSGTGRKPSR